MDDNEAVVYLDPPYSIILRSNGKFWLLKNGNEIGLPFNSEAAAREFFTQKKAKRKRQIRSGGVEL